MLCEGFFIPLIQLLSSQTVFPSGSEARATVCHSLVLILLKTGEKLGRERSLVLLLETLRLFFTCFDGVTLHTSSSSDAQQRRLTESSVTNSSRYSTQVSAPGLLTNGERERSSTESPVSSGIVPRASSNQSKAVSLDGEDPLGATSEGGQSSTSHPLSSNSKKPFTGLSPPDLALEQLHATFSPAMAHAAYIPFCKLLGQIKLNTELCNTELIEQIAYSYDENVQQNSSLPSVFTSSEKEELSSSSDSETEDSTGEERTEDDIAHDVTIKVGPIVALQRRWGLDKDAVNFGRSNWFVDLNQDSVSDATSVTTSSGVTSGVVERGSESQGTAGVISGVSGSGVGVSSGVVGSMEVTRSAVGDDGGGGRGWMEGVRGSAVATASGILQLIQSKPVPDAPQGPVTKADYLSRNSVNFDMKFQPATSTAQPGQTLMERR